MYYRVGMFSVGYIYILLFIYLLIYFLAGGSVNEKDVRERHDQLLYVR